jgi:hypothetical protein
MAFWPPPPYISTVILETLNGWTHLYLTPAKKQTWVLSVSHVVDIKEKTNNRTGGQWRNQEFSVGGRLNQHH